MKRLVTGIGLAVAVALGAAACGDDDATTEGVTVGYAWARPTPAGTTIGAVYTTVTAGADDSIISASVAADVAADAQFHETGPAPETSADETDMLMTMRQLERIDLVAGEPFQFAPGATHIMIIDLVEPFTLGQEFTVELQLESGGSAPVAVVVADTPPPE